MSELEQLTGHMQSFELLGGKYQQGEQIVPGVIQTFRSYEMPTGRPVFIHRIPTDNAVAKEIAELLSEGLIHSSAVRKMIVDVYETKPYRFVVTEPSYECVPLRAWLGRESRELIAEPEEKAPLAAAPIAPEAAKAEKPPEPPAADAEFARLFHEALSGKVERAKKTSGSPTVPPKPEIKQERPEQKPLSTPASVQSAESAQPAPAEPSERDLPPSYQIPQLFTPESAKPSAGRSTLIVSLVVAAVVVVAIAMFVVFFVKR